MRSNPRASTKNIEFNKENAMFARLTDSLVNILGQILTGAINNQMSVTTSEANAPETTDTNPLSQEVQLKQMKPTVVEPPVVPPPKIMAPATKQCRNREHPDTGAQCTNRLPLGHRSGLCDDCVHSCWGGCGRTIPVWHTYCPNCSEFATKPCKGCSVEIPADGGLYCSDCGHQCAGPDCKAMIPNYFKYCMADACQDAKWYEENSPQQTTTSTSTGAKDWKKFKKDRAKARRKAAPDGRDPKGQR
ncbi:MAG: hypothetical protein HYT15_00805 [Candidatus Magasanikbacteria bacterium]|nr:hypothetical protein [Candidatus Magasanikbacteria bacterium]